MIVTLWQPLIIIIVASAALTGALVALMKWQEGVIRREEADEPRGFPVKPIDQVEHREPK